MTANQPISNWAKRRKEQLGLGVGATRSFGHAFAWLGSLEALVQRAPQAREGG